MRGPDGYGGPVAHWWGDCLRFTGVGLDWRYEGIIIGYLNLYERTGDEVWLTKARRAGDDLVRGQLPGGSFRDSCFEINPYTGGTPHEAACDLALLRLARTLQGAGDPAWATYAETAEHNLQGFILPVLWDAERRLFRNTATDPTFVPNKGATVVEALLAWAALAGDEGLVEAYVVPTLDAILACQETAPEGPLYGAICQAAGGGRKNERFFPFYIARCIPALLQGYHAVGERRYRWAARTALGFLLRQRLEDGSFPQVVYGDGRVNRYPQWIAGAGEMLRAMALAGAEGLEVDLAPTQRWLLAGVEATGGVRTAHGFASQVSQREPGALPDWRDLLSVCGWADKAFRYLTGQVSGALPADDTKPDRVEAECRFQGQLGVYREDGDEIVWENGQVGYHWQKGASWASVCRG
jgi:hypothetical protein